MSKSSRKTFLKQSALLAAAPFVTFKELKSAEYDYVPESENKPMVISTWQHGLAANKEAWKYIQEGKSALDAVEAGVKIPEADPAVNSVGYGGYPDNKGRVTLDACIMDGNGNCGAVSFLEHIKHPISVARKVMEETTHVMLSGSGALSFATKQGFKQEDLMTDQSRLAYTNWLNRGSEEKLKAYGAEKSESESESESVEQNENENEKENEEKKEGSVDNHDTIGMLAIDKAGNIAGACTTSGLAWKLNGRVGDSPIIGAGLFVDGEVGGATATGRGEAVIKIAGTAVIVELMRQGKHPQEACEEAILRIMRKQEDFKDFQVGFLAINLKGEIGACSLHKGFQYALAKDGEEGLKDAPFKN